jgi:hypothetical protein
MGQFIQTNGDYNIKAKEGARIKLDTGPGVGEVRVTGNLVVEGQTLTVDAENLNVKDNIIILNYGESNAGVSLEYSGIQIDRGSLPAASLLYNEISDTWVFASGVAPGPFNFSETSRIQLTEIITPSTLQDDGDLRLIGTGRGVVNVFGTETYEDWVTHDDDIPNKKYVDDAIRNNPTFQVIDDDTRVIITDADVAGANAYLFSQTGYATEGNTSAISVLVDGTLVSQFYEDRLLVGQPGVNGIEIDGINFEIRTEALHVSAQDIFIKTTGGGRLRHNYALQLDSPGSTPPGSVSGAVQLWNMMPGVGETGVWFVNDSTDTSKQNGELISKNKALVFSMLF